MAEDVKERLLRYLNDAHAAETGGIQSLTDIAAEATDPEVKSAISEHITVTQSQADRLEARIIALGGTKNAGKGFLNSIIAKGSDLLNIGHDIEDKQTQDVIKAYSLEHFEVGMYLSLKAYSEAIGDHETAQLATTIIGEEQLAAERLQRLIPKIAVYAVSKTTNATV